MEFNDDDFEIINFTLNPELRNTYTYQPSDGTKGFYIWQFDGVIIHKPTGYKVCFSDTPSGCGPVQVYSYNSCIKTLCTILPYAMYKAVNGLNPFSEGVTAFTFIQGNPNKIFVKKAIEELGAEVKIYSNSRHCHRDVQAHFYIDMSTRCVRSEYRESLFKKRIKDIEEKYEGLNVQIMK
jgi:hypothetical protein